MGANAVIRCREEDFGAQGCWALSQIAKLQIQNLPKPSRERTRLGFLSTFVRFSFSVSGD